MDKKSVRSSSYQPIFAEIACSVEQLAEFSNGDSISSHLNPFGYNEEYDELKDRLLAAFWRIVDADLTERQSKIIHMYAKEGKTQTAIAKELGVNQSSITKSINGNCDYRNKKKVYGGAKKRIKKIAEKDPEIQQILAEMMEMQGD